MSRRTLIRHSTGDRGPPAVDEQTQILTNEQLGPNMSRTPNGNLLCKNVPIARVGWMIYGPGEVPIDPGPDGIVRVYRGPAELFSAETIGSFMGAAVVDEHPDDDVTPTNWKKLSMGFSTTNVRQGEGADDDVLLADLMVTDEDLITSILAGKREVSCGYDADYEQTNPGEGLQTNILGNHIALVEKGRCGPRCAIGDRSYLKENEMPEKTKPRARVKLHTQDRRAALRQSFLDAAEDLMDQMEPETMDGMDNEGATHIHIHQGQGSGVVAGDPGVKSTANGSLDDMENQQNGDPIEARIAALEESVKSIAEMVAKLTSAEQAEDEQSIEPKPQPDMMNKDEMPDMDPEDMATSDEVASDLPKETLKTMDSAALANGFKALLAKAEILVPGYRVPTFDAAAKRHATVDTMCKTRRSVLTAVYATKDGKALVDGISGKGSLDLAKIPCAQVTTLFNAAAGAKAMLNNRQATGDALQIPPQQATKATSLIADINAKNAAFWAARKPTV